MDTTRLETRGRGLLPSPSFPSKSFLVLFSLPTVPKVGDRGKRSVWLIDLQLFNWRSKVATHFEGHDDTITLSLCRGAPPSYCQPIVFPRTGHCEEGEKPQLCKACPSVEVPTGQSTSFPADTGQKAAPEWFLYDLFSWRINTHEFFFR